MQIRIATPTDWPKIRTFIANMDYYDPMHPDNLGGNWIVLLDDSDKVIGTIWWFEGQGHAYVDYWAGTGIRSGAAVALALDQFLKNRNIQYVHGMINANNERAVRTALRLGMVTTTIPYFSVTKELHNGSE